jgi:antirestriction protein ArdC
MPTNAATGRSYFTGREHFIATKLHERSHWSGHKKRLDRDLSGRFQTRAYAAEEYIGSWIGLLRDDNSAVFTSAAADYLRSFSEQIDETPPE